MFIVFILSRLLFIASMVFIIGYVFGNFSKSAALKTITKVATILMIVFFITANIFFFSNSNWHQNHTGNNTYCGWHQQKDSTGIAH